MYTEDMDDLKSTVATETALTMPAEIQKPVCKCALFHGMSWIKSARHTGSWNALRVKN